MHALVHLAICTLAENTELCVFAELGLTKLNKWGRGLTSLHYFRVTVLGEGVTAHAGVTFSFICLFQGLSKSLVWTLSTHNYFLRGALYLLASMLNGRLRIGLYETLLGEWLFCVSLLHSESLHLLWRRPRSHNTIYEALAKGSVESRVGLLEGLVIFWVGSLFWSAFDGDVALIFYEAAAFSHGWKWLDWN